VEFLGPDLWVSDIIYVPSETELLKHARARSAYHGRRRYGRVPSGRRIPAVYRHRGRQRPHARPFPIDARLGPRLPIGGGPPPSAIAPFRHRAHTLEPIQGVRRPGKKPVPRMPLARRRCRPVRPVVEKQPVGPKIPSTHFRRRPPMRSGEKPSASTITRRGFLKRAGAAAGAAGLAPAISAPFVADALAQTKTLRIIQWSH